MASGFSTSPPADAGFGLGQWRDAFCRQMFALDISSSDPQFSAALLQGQLGPARASRLVAGPQRVVRSERLIARDRSLPALDLVVVRAGLLDYQQAGRAGRVGAGEAVLLDRRQPYRFDASASRSLALSLDHDWLARWVARPEALAGLRIDQSTGWGRAIAAIADQLDADGLGPFAVPGGVIADQIGSLIALAAGPACDAPPDDPRYRRLVQLVQDRAHEPSLDADAAAAALGLSRRTLYLLCARAGTSFGRLLMQARLARARDMLADAGTRALPVQEIAFRCGFADPAHFSRRFARAFGRPPAQWRSHLHG